MYEEIEPWLYWENTGDRVLTKAVELRKLRGSDLFVISSWSIQAWKTIQNIKNHSWRPSISGLLRETLRTHLN